MVRMSRWTKRRKDGQEEQVEEKEDEKTEGEDEVENIE